MTYLVGEFKIHGTLIEINLKHQIKIAYQISFNINLNLI